MREPAGLHGPERRIEEAIAQGALDDLPAKGEPLALEDVSNVPHDLRPGHLLLKGAGVLPEEMELRNSVLRVEDLIAVRRDAAERLDLLDRRRLLVLRYALEMKMRQRSASDGRGTWSFARFAAFDGCPMAPDTIRRRVHFPLFPKGVPVLVPLLALTVSAVANGPVVHKEYLPKNFSYERAAAISKEAWTLAEQKNASERTARAGALAKADQQAGPARAAVRKILADDPALKAFEQALADASKVSDPVARKKAYATVNQKYASLLSTGLAKAGIDAVQLEKQIKSCFGPASILMPAAIVTELVATASAPPPKTGEVWTQIGPNYPVTGTLFAPPSSASAETGGAFSADAGPNFGVSTAWIGVPFTLPANATSAEFTLALREVSLWADGGLVGSQSPGFVCANLQVACLREVPAVTPAAPSSLPVPTVNGMNYVPWWTSSTTSSVSIAALMGGADVAITNSNSDFIVKVTRPAGLQGDIAGLVSLCAYAEVAMPQLISVNFGAHCKGRLAQVKMRLIP